VNGLHNIDAVYQAVGRAVPFCQHQDALGRQGVDGFSELGPIAHVFAAGLFAIDLFAAFSAQSCDLAVQVLVKARDARVSDFQHKPPIYFRNDF